MLVITFQYSNDGTGSISICSADIYFAGFFYKRTILTENIYMYIIYILFACCTGLNVCWRDVYKRQVLKLDRDEERQEAIFAIEDTGCGIPLEKQPHIFERFEKLHEGVQGAGLGLSICQLIIENIGGKIWIDSSYTLSLIHIY